MMLGWNLKTPWLISLLLLANALVAQTVDETIAKADSMQKHDILCAVDLYNRALYFSDDIRTDELLHLRLAYLNHTIKRFETAAWHYKQVAILQQSDSLFLESAWQYLYGKKANESLKIAQQIDTTFINKNDYYLLVGLCYEYLQNDSSALANYARLTLSDTQQKEQAILNKKLLKLHYKKPNLAFALSLILPGLGQAYAGNLKDGVNALLLQGALTTGLCFTIISYSWVEGTLFFSPWIMRYYIGGANNAKLQAQKTNEQKRTVLLNKRLSLYAK